VSICTTTCHKCCTLHVCGKHEKCFRELSVARRAELLAGLQRAGSVKRAGSTQEAGARALAERERSMAGWLRHFNGGSEPDFEFTVESANAGLARNLVCAKRFDAARRQNARKLRSA
jgi:hypothetical protein